MAQGIFNHDFNDDFSLFAKAQVANTRLVNKFSNHYNLSIFSNNESLMGNSLFLGFDLGLKYSDFNLNLGYIDTAKKTKWAFIH